MSIDPHVATPGERQRPSRARRLLLGVAAFLLVITMGFVPALAGFQTSLIFPGAATQGRPEAAIRTGPGEELISKDAPGGKVVALFGAATDAAGRPLGDAATRPALVFFYGNAMCAAYAQPLAQRLRSLGLNVLVPDYLGYGLSGGKPSEQGCRETADACRKMLADRGFTADRVFVGGWSLGGAVAIDLAAREPSAGLFAFSTFTNMRDMARGLVPFPLPEALFQHKFDSLAAIAKVKCPILLGHGRRDSIVPFAMHAKLAAATAPKAVLVVDRADHNDFFEVAGPRVDRAILDLVARGLRKD